MLQSLTSIEAMGITLIERLDQAAAIEERWKAKYEELLKSKEALVEQLEERVRCVACKEVPSSLCTV